MNANAEKSRQELAQISAFSSAQFIGPEKAEDEDNFLNANQLLIKIDLNQ